jgi:16S rRNA (guanine527-N7)-methyltransferase
MTPDSIPSLPLAIDHWQATLHWQPNDAQQQQFQQLYHQVLIANQHLNLTRITDPLEFWEKHLWDSLRGVAPCLSTPTPQQVIDIGTGAGFPALPLAIACPHWQITALDATRKKVEFIRTSLPAIPLANVSPMVGRAETVGHLPTHREQYDLALLRAVAAAPICAEYALPLVAVGGQAVLYRGQWTPEEDSQLQAAVAQLGGAIAQVDAFTTPLTQGIRHSIYIRKVSPTPPTYPRPTGIPKQHPLAPAP